VSTILPDKPTVEMSVTDHVHEAWRPPPAGEDTPVTLQLADCHSWSEVEAEATASWRASVGSLTTEPTEAPL
jgi:hypothetical protein